MQFIIYISILLNTIFDIYSKIKLSIRSFIHLLRETRKRQNVTWLIMALLFFNVSLYAGTTGNQCSNTVNKILRNNNSITTSSGTVNYINNSNQQSKYFYIQAQKSGWVEASLIGSTDTQRVGLNMSLDGCPTPGVDITQVISFPEASDFNAIVNAKAIGSFGFDVQFTLHENQFPVAQSNEYTTIYMTTKTGNVITDGTAAQADYDPDGDKMVILSYTQPLYGTVTIDSDGTFSYTPNQGFSNDRDTFTYTIEDLDQRNDSKRYGTSTATVTINVEAAPSAPPIANNKNYVMDMDTTLQGNAITDTPADSDPNNDPLTISGNTEPSNGTLAISSNGAFSYTPTTGFVGTDSFTYSVTDGPNNTTATISIKVQDPNNLVPTATDNQYRAIEGTTMSGNIITDDPADSGILSGDTIVINSNTNPAHGTFNLSSDGGFTYRPATDEDTSFTYSIKDQNGVVSNTATVTFSIDDTLPSEPVPPVGVDDGDGDAVTPVCGSFEDVLQTRTNPSKIEQKSSGVDATIFNNPDCTLTTGEIDWVSNKSLFCAGGVDGKADASGSYAESIDLDFDQKPDTSSIVLTNNSERSDIIITSSGQIKYSDDVVRDNIKFAQSSYNDATIHFRQIQQIDEMQTTNGNTYLFETPEPYFLEIDKLKKRSGSAGTGNTFRTVSIPKNIKVTSIILDTDTTIDFEAKQTIKIDTVDVTKTGNDIKFKAPYVKINSLDVEGTIEITADYVDIGSLKLGKDTKLVIKPYTDGARVLFRSNSIVNSNTSQMLLYSGNYHTELLDVPGSSNGSTIVAADADQLINFYLDGNFAPGNKPGINSADNKGTFGDLPPANFFFFVSGDLDIGAGGTTMNATVYVEGDVYFAPGSFLKGALSAGGDITIDSGGAFTYDQNIADGGWGECTIEIVANADDLCYGEVKYEGMFCMDMGIFKGGMGCVETIPIKNLGEDLLTNVEVVIDKSGMTGSMMSDCGIDGVSGKCIETNAVDMGPAGMFGQSVLFDPMPDFAKKTEHEIYTKSMMSMSMFSGNNLYGEYIKNNKKYIGAIEACPIIINVEFESTTYQVTEDIYNIGSKVYSTPTITLSQIVNYDITVEYYTEDGTATVADGDYVRVLLNTVTIPAGQKSVKIPIAIYNDAPIELDEYFLVHLQNPTTTSNTTDILAIGEKDRTKITITGQEDSPTCFEDDFNGGLDSKWRVLDASGGWTPDVYEVKPGDNRLRITDNNRNRSALITKDYEFESSQNLIIVEFDYHAYGGCGNNGGIGDYGADGIVNILFDSSVGDEPQGGGSGGSMGYAQYVNGKDGFEGGWLGLGLDEYGNFGNCNESRSGGLPNTSCDSGRFFSPGSYTNTAVLRGDGHEDSGYEFLKGVRLIEDLNQLPVAAKRADGMSDFYSGRYKLIVDARDPSHLYIKLQRSLTGDENHYQTLIERFDAKEAKYNQGITPAKVRYAISSGTGGGCNYHELSWIKLRGNCAAYAVGGAYTTGPFGVKDTWRAYTDYNISTKISDKPFDLEIVSRDETGKGKETKNGVNAKYSLYYADNNDTGLSAGGKRFKQYSFSNGEPDIYDFNSSTHASVEHSLNPNNPTSNKFTIPRSFREMYVRIEYCADWNQTSRTTTLHPYSACDGLPALTENEHHEGLNKLYHTSDKFAVRPLRFQITDNTPSQLIKSGEDFNITIDAIPVNAQRTSNYADLSSGIYNDYEQEGKDINVISSKLFKNGDVDITNSLKGTFGMSPDQNYSITHSQSTVRPDDGKRLTPAQMTKNDVAAFTFDDVGQIRYGFIDDSWADIDIKDSPDGCDQNSDETQPFSRFICTPDDNNGTKTFIPHHFEIEEVKVANHREGDFTYIADKDSFNRLPMAAIVSTNIRVVNDENGTCENFHTDDDDKYYDHDVAVNILFSNDPNESNASLKDLVYSHPKNNVADGINNILLVESNAAAELDFEKGVTSVENNSTSMPLKFNFDRIGDEPIHPFGISENDVYITVDANYTDGVNTIPIGGQGNNPDAVNNQNNNGNVTGTLTDSTDATFFYARARPTKLFYDKVLDSNISTPIMINIYCESFTAPTCASFASTTNAFDSILGLTDIPNWYLATTHNSSLGDGSVRLVRSPNDSLGNVLTNGVIEGQGDPKFYVSNAYSNDINISILNNGTNADLRVHRGNAPTIPLTVAISLMTGVNGTSNWLIYNQFDPINAPEPYYKVRFIDRSVWTGEGDKGVVVDGAASYYKSRRLDW